jgi:hypothetical protein
MRRRIVIALLGLGVFAGYGSAIAGAVHHHRMHHAACAHWHHGEEEAPPQPPQP